VRGCDTCINQIVTWVCMATFVFDTCRGGSRAWAALGPRVSTVVDACSQLAISTSGRAVKCFQANARP